MKHAIIAAVAVVLLLVGAYVGMQYATAAKAKEIVSEVMEKLYIEEELWSYDSAYVNPITKTLHVKNLQIENEWSGDVTSIGSISAKQHSDDGEVMVISVKASAIGGSDVSMASFVLDELAINKNGDIEAIYTEDSPILGIGSMSMNGVASSVDSGSLFMASLKLEGPMDFTNLSGTLNLAIADLAFDIEGMSIAFQTITSNTTYADGGVTQEFSMNGKDLFKLDMNYQLAGIETGPMVDLYSFLGNAQLVGGQATYTEQGLLNMILDESGMTLDDLISEIDRGRSDLAYVLEDADIITDAIIEYLKNPETIAVVAGNTEPVGLFYILGSGDISELNLSASFNGAEALPIRTSSYEDDYNYDDYDYEYDDYNDDDSYYEDEYDGSYDNDVYDYDNDSFFGNEQ